MVTEEMVQAEVWGWKSVVAEARKALEDKGWPKPNKPKLNLESLVFPEDIDALSSVQLANIAMRFQGWYAYITTELAYVKAEYAAIGEMYEAKIGNSMHEMQKTMPSKPTKGVLQSLVLNQLDIRPWFKVKLQKEQEVFLIEGIEAGLKIQCHAIRDEQIRRMSAQKVEIGGFS